MRLKWLLFVLGLALAFTSAVFAGDKAKKTSKRGVKGIVTAVQTDQAKDSGLITIKVQPKAKPGETAGEAKEEKFIITTATKFEKVTRISKGETKREAATFKDVTTGVSVRIHATADNKKAAKTVEILMKKSKK